METTQIGHWERHRSPTMANGERRINIFVSFLSVDLGAAMWPRATPDFRTVSAISSFLLQDIPRHPDIVIHPFSRVGGR